MSYNHRKPLDCQLTTDIIERIDYLRFLLVKAEKRLEMPIYDMSEYRDAAGQPPHLRGLIAPLQAELSRRNVVNS